MALSNPCHSHSVFFVKRTPSCAGTPVKRQKREHAKDGSDVSEEEAETNNFESDGEAEANNFESDGEVKPDDSERKWHAVAVCSGIVHKKRRSSARSITASCCEAETVQKDLCIW